MIDVLTDPKRVRQLLMQRALLMVLLIVVLLTVLFARLAFLQIHQHHAYTTLSDRNQLTMIPIQPSRGLIYDRHGVLLADNLPEHRLELILQSTRDARDILNKVAGLISLSDSERHRFAKLLRQRRPFEPIPIKTKLTDREVALMAERLHELPGVRLHSKLVRHYPLKSMTASFMGYTGLMDEYERAHLHVGNYAAADDVGKVGIEKQYESQLHGQIGYQWAEIDARGHIVHVQKTVLPQSGADLYLTIDSRLQQTVHQAMTGQSGAVVALDPRNGEVLALASLPSYDPNAFYRGQNQVIAGLNQSKAKPLFNRALSGSYPLASTIKPFLALQGLETEVVTPDFQIHDPGWYKLPHHSHVFRDLSWKSGGRGWVNLKRSIVVSSDTYYYHLAYLMGIDSMSSILSQFGFGRTTGVDLPYESTGVLPTPAWKKQHKKNEPWYPADTILVGIGQGLISATPMQLAVATAMLAQRGVSYQPHLILRTSHSKPGDDVPAIRTKLQLNHPEAWEQVIRAMSLSITEGTGWRFGKKMPYSVAGKTGTAQVFNLRKYDHLDPDNLPEHLRDHSIFIVFAPVEEPTIALVVVAEHSKLAPAIARKVLDGYFQSQIETG